MPYAGNLQRSLEIIAERFKPFRVIEGVVHRLFTLAVILAAFCFSSLGNIFSIPPTNLPATVNMIASVVKFPVVFISGIFIPLDELPAWGRAVSYISPLTYFTDIARYCIQRKAHLPVYIDFLALLAYTTLFLIVAMKFHRRTMPVRI